MVFELCTRVEGDNEAIIIKYYYVVGLSGVNALVTEHQP